MLFTYIPIYVSMCVGRSVVGVVIGALLLLIGLGICIFIFVIVIFLAVKHKGEFDKQ